MLARVIRAVIFDLDGTLVNSLAGIAASLNRVLKSNGLPTHPEITVRTFIGNGIVKLVERAVPGHFNGEQIQTLARAVSKDYATTWKQGTSPYPGVADVLLTLFKQGIKTAVFSNKPHAFCKEMTDLLFPGISFTAVIGQREGVPLKPDPAGALDVANSLGSPADKIAFVGDSTVDIETAHNAGMISVGCSWGYHDLPALETTSPDHLITHISGLVTIINEDTVANGL